MVCRKSQSGSHWLDLIQLESQPNCYGQHDSCFHEAWIMCLLLELEVVSLT